MTNDFIGMSINLPSAKQLGFTLKYDSICICFNTYN